MSFADGKKRPRDDELNLASPPTPLHKRARIRVTKVVQSVLTRYFISSTASAPLPPRSGGEEPQEDSDD